MSRAEELTEEQWAVIEHLFPELQPREDARGRPPADTLLLTRPRDLSLQVRLLFRGSVKFANGGFERRACLLKWAQEVYVRQAHRARRLVFLPIELPTWRISAPRRRA
ncbi:MAG: hypothetical protein V1796_06430 [Pseudomonadota bacterium]